MKISNKADLIAYLNRGNKVKYLFFWGHQATPNGIGKSCFSQWYDSPFDAAGIYYRTAEHYMMYQKAHLFGDDDAAKKILGAATPGEAKALGRAVKGFENTLWEAKKIDIVVAANMAKFNSNTEIKKFLLATGNRILVEASPVDKIWGIGLAADNPACENPNQWRGENLLGFALMAVRNQLT